MSKIEKMEQKISEKVGYTFLTTEDYLYELMKIFAEHHIVIFFISVDACRYQLCSKFLAVLTKEPETSELKKSLCSKVAQLFLMDKE